MNLLLKDVVYLGREEKGLSQRKLARKIGISNTALSDIESGKVKQPSFDILQKIAEELDLSLENLLNLSGYNKISFMLDNASGKYKSKSKMDLQLKIREHEMSQLEMLDDMYKKRTIVRDNRTRLIHLIDKLNDYDYYKSIWTIEKINEELKEICEDLKPACKKYDYSKLPKD